MLFKSASIELKNFSVHGKNSLVKLIEHEFLCCMEILYKKVPMTLDVHSLTHLTNSVFDWGPLWVYDAFGFESGNGPSYSK